ncbi:MAG: hypothetical protein IT437_06430 [Phycisphaerales bacterium]|nr:hypothetical protein [Phycisphaerales bacterium]
MRAIGIEPGLTPLDPRVDAVAGRVLVLPVAISGPYDPGTPLSVLLDDGRRLQASLYWISISPPVGAAQAWLPADGDWSSTPAAADVRPRGPGFWAITALLPADAAGQGLWLARERINLNWLPEPDTIKVDDSVWTRLVTPERMSGTQLGRLVESEWRSPPRRWRHRLLTRGLRPSPVDASPPLPGEPADLSVTPEGFADPVLEAWARQVECRWQIGLAWLAQADGDVADRLRRRLGGVVDFGGGVLAPAWPTAPNELDALLSDLVSTRITPTERAARARAWLEAQPAAAAWVVDDASLRDAATGSPLSTLGVANIGDRATLTWASSGGEPAGPELVPLAVGATRQLVAAPAAGVAQGHVTIHAGRWSAVRMVSTGPLTAGPPGLRLGPLLPDWSMPGWVAGVYRPAPPVGDAAWATSALLTREGQDEPRWVLLVECRTTDPAPEILRFWFGPFGTPVTTVRIAGAGTVTEEGRTGIDAGVIVRRDKDRWSAAVAIPASCIDGDGRIVLGLERTDARGRHTAWPRPMLPWQFEPGRVLIDTGGWGDLGAGALPPPDK